MAKEKKDKKDKKEKGGKQGGLDITTIIGVVFGFAVIIVGCILSGNLLNMWDASSVFIVLGGTIGAVVASYPLGMLKKIPQHMKFVFQADKHDPVALIDSLVEFAQTARKNGLLALEEKAMNLEDPFYKRSIMLIIDALEAETIKSVLEAEIESMAARHDEEIEMYNTASACSPAFGMIGTLIGLINMLKSMNLEEGGSDSLGLNMSVALITTLYGVVMANLVYSPIARKLEKRNNEEILYRQIIIDGVLGIQAGDNPKSLKEMLVSSLPTKQQAILLGEVSADEGKKKGKKKKGKK